MTAAGSRRFWLFSIVAMLALLPLAVRAEGPAFKVDPSWPLPLPNNWILGQVGGLALDAQDNVWVFQRPRSLTADEKAASLNAPSAKCWVPTPSMLVYDREGKFVQS